MEFPNIGAHCSHPPCNKLDFLPVKCDACSQIFCHEHMKYVDHMCPQGKAKDVQVPVCPLCNKPVPSKPTEPPDVAVSAHIDRDCESDPATSRRKVYSNKCFMKGCRKKELVPFICPNCHTNFCITHRHPADHNCHIISAPQNSIIPSAPPSISAGYEAIQGNMEEDEALAHAIALSLNENDNAMNCRREHAQNQSSSLNARTEEDEALACAIAISLNESDNELNCHREIALDLPLSIVSRPVFDEASSLNENDNATNCRREQEQIQLSLTTARSEEDEASLLNECDNAMNCHRELTQNQLSSIANRTLRNSDVKCTIS